MALIKFGSGFNINNSASYDVDDTIGSGTRTTGPTGFSVADTRGNSVTVSGNGFGYGGNGDWIRGIADSITIIKNGQLVIEATGLAVEGNSNVYDTGFGGEAPGMQAEVAYWLRGNDTIISSNGNEYIKGFGGNDVIQAGAGNDIIDGGTGVDTAVYAASAASYQVNKTSNGYSVIGGPDGGDSLLNVERIRFADKTIALDIGGNAGQAYRLYQAAFDRKPDHAGLGAQINGLDSGMSLLQISQNFINSAEFQQRYGANPSNEAFVTLLYANVLHRVSDADGYAVQVNALNAGMSRAQLLVNFSESNENFNATLVGIQNGIDFTPIA
jgi:Ca2+-binding RTX toxin-like protein